MTSYFKTVDIQGNAETLMKLKFDTLNALTNKQTSNIVLVNKRWFKLPVTFSITISEFSRNTEPSRLYPLNLHIYDPVSFIGLILELGISICRYDKSPSLHETLAVASERFPNSKSCHFISLFDAIDKMGKLDRISWIPSTFIWLLQLTTQLISMSDWPYCINTSLIFKEIMFNAEKKKKKKHSCYFPWNAIGPDDVILSTLWLSYSKYYMYICKWRSSFDETVKYWVPVSQQIRHD